ncbi:thiazole biosynthesis adenylyltransferase ThiF [Bacillus aquiflavi]|uniref:Thiazole biosynthesis adenylyltransferase ThiF n=1 Tax=Bacillus aquiflavi TaxID=2672567 RepID=A0A6B3W2C4_9BACI|nr:thiazole biosynthesis adenylyltransferase ThiF [Bacillus aquiflavi]MBA4537429.1 thiazole biosynthesis adenylyltransferase ThiF [Bacillus aquiflavi]NEY81684.1 thiazole biosynthesis adenylyltransferase ThiF [Bacillus aquiflavi]UAC47975.1 thiazole biosynthesis adenylyltransferase ThiF [Bacillus aquiflavi]
MTDRYSRQELFSAIGKAGQQKIRSKHVLIIGAGALGSGNADILTRAGVGKLTIVDRDYVEESNLQRQQLYVEDDVKKKLPKVIAAKKRLNMVNSDVEINAVIADVNPEKLEQLANGVDLIIDATDNFETRMAINDMSQKLRIPWIYGACVSSIGMSYTIIPGKTPCLNCLLKMIPVKGMTCDTGGIISPAVQMVIVHQTTEALKILVEDWENVRTTFISFDLWRNQYTNLKMSKAKDSSCLSCGRKPAYPYLQSENLTKTTVLCGRDTVQIRPPKKMELHLQELARQLTDLGLSVSGNPFLLSVDVNENRLVIFKDGRALIHGTKDLKRARAIYHRLLG